MVCLVNIFQYKKIGDYVLARNGMKTGNNDIFIRFWWEISEEKSCFSALNYTMAINSRKKWFPYNKGGEFRKWYGNNDYVVNWENKGSLVIGNAKADGRNVQDYPIELKFKPLVTWSLITSSLPSFRYKVSCINDIAGMSFWDTLNNDLIYYLLALVNSKFSEETLKIIAPTINYQCGDINRIPVVISESKKNTIEFFSKQNIALSKSDWDSFETSWDFVRHPLVKVKTENGKLKNEATPRGEWCVISDGCDCSNTTGEGDLKPLLEEGCQPKADGVVTEFVVNPTLMEQVSSQGNWIATQSSTARNDVLNIDEALEGNPLPPTPYTLRPKTLLEAFSQWEAECLNRFNQLKSNEEELNRIFIDIYGLNDELTPEVEDKDVTVRKADLQRDIRSFISYAVGCMMGRYSPYYPGLQYAGGDWQTTNYKLSTTNFPPDEDGIIPITDDEYFDDDIVGRFIDFVKEVYGSDTLEENLSFIANALGGKGFPRQVIRNYFISDFYADHTKIYQKRPIYWLFDSGKKNGFKCLIYMHRYQPDTIARIRTDYIHEQQSRYRTAIADLEQRINGASTSERVKLSKQLAKVQDQAEEIRLYEEKIHHLADQMIKIDLDDGVKVNYAKFADVLAKIK